MTNLRTKKAPVGTDKLAARTMAVLEELLADYQPRDFAIELWDGRRLGPDPAEFCRFTWRIQRASALRALLRSDRQVALGGAYDDEDFDLTGDFLGIFGLAEHLEQKHLAPAT
jgi:hypothetical protein